MSSMAGVGAGAAGAGGQNSPGSSGQASGVQAFLDYMKETPAQRMEDNWLRAHGLTRQSLAAMSPKQQQAVMDQMKQDIENQMKRVAEAKSTGKAMVPGGML